jgi:hypothetical protein
VLKSKAPSATVDQVLSALTSTGLPITDSRNNVTKPRIKVDAALNALGGGGGGQYSSGTVVTLTATPSAGFNFQSWTGCDSVAGNTCTVTMNASRTVTALFMQSVALKIDNVSPRAGRAAGGQSVKLTGEFTGLSTVTMGGVPASWSYSNGTSEITVTSPAHAVGAVDFLLTPASGSSYTRTKAFAYLPTAFTDDPLIAGVTTAKVQHITELRQAVDALRAVSIGPASGPTPAPGPAPWTDPTLLPFVGSIKAAHIMELRTYLNDEATRLGYATSPYTDPTVTSSFQIKRIHIEELRQRIRAIAG